MKGQTEVNRITGVIIPHLDHEGLTRAVASVPMLYPVVVRRKGSFAENVNLCVPAGDERHGFVIMNDDAEVSRELMTAIEKTDGDVVGMVPSGGSAGGRVSWNEEEDHLRIELAVGEIPRQDKGTVAFPSGACFYVRHRVFRVVGGLDVRFRNGCEDIDFFLRVLEKRFRIEYLPANITFKHDESATRGRDIPDFKNRKLLHHLWFRERFETLLKSIED